jgi:hypothetical protein
MQFGHLFRAGLFEILELLRDRPFNLQGGYGFLFRSEFFFRTTRELEYLFFCRAKREFFSRIQHYVIRQKL